MSKDREIVGGQRIAHRLNVSSLRTLLRIKGIHEINGRQSSPLRSMKSDIDSFMRKKRGE